MVNEEFNDLGKEMHSLVERLYPINRSLTGDGVRKTFSILKESLPELQIHEVPSGTQCFDWVVPDEWNIRDGYITSPAGDRLADFKKCNLHVLGYSEPVDMHVSLGELENHLFSNPAVPDAVPYVTSYYERNWGFAISHREREELLEGQYHVYIDSTLESGHLTFGELYIPGESDHEILLSTYVCHPSMANNELSGPVVTTFLARWLCRRERLRYSYRIVFVPETIGSILYLSQNLLHLKNKVVAGFNISCVGDDRSHSYLPSRLGDTVSDRIALHVLHHYADSFTRYTFLDRGSDERQYCSPGVDLPIASVMRTKYGTYPEYHTSNDNLSFVTPTGLLGGYEPLQLCISALEENYIYESVILGEPQLSRRNLYPTIGASRYGDTATLPKTILNILTYCDGAHDLISIADRIDMPIWEVLEVIDLLKNEGLVRRIDE